MDITIKAPHNCRIHLQHRPRHSQAPVHQDHHMICYRPILFISFLILFVLYSSISKSNSASSSSLSSSSSPMHNGLLALTSSEALRDAPHWKDSCRMRSASTTIERSSSNLGVRDYTVSFCDMYSFLAQPSLGQSLTRRLVGSGIHVSFLTKSPLWTVDNSYLVRIISVRSYRRHHRARNK